MTEVHKVRFPSGLELKVPAGMDPTDFLNRHQYMSLVEGMCPIHQARLDVMEADSRNSPGSGLPWLHHDGCFYYWQVDTDEQAWTQEPWWSWAGYDPPGWSI
jgi:hypothetical protein